MDFRDALGCEVDVVTDAGLRDRLRDDVLAVAAAL
jgi:predicted nucleotidyltransferase